MAPSKTKRISLFLGGSEGAETNSVASSNSSSNRLQKPEQYPPPAPLHPPPPIPGPASRSPSPGQGLGRPGTPPSDTGGSRLAPVEEKKKRRVSRLFGGGASSSNEQVHQQQAGPLAWVLGHQGKVPYNLTMLLNGEKVPELWDEEGDTFVYLFPRMSNKGPSFRLDSSLYSDSQYLTRLVHGQLYSENSAGLAPLPDRTPQNSSGNYGSSRANSPDRSTVEGSTSDGSKGSRALSDAAEDDRSEKHLYVPIALSTDREPVTPTTGEPRLQTKDIDTLITYRNFFSFLVGQSIVATERHSEIFDVFMRVADILHYYQFSNIDGSTFGEVATSSFNAYIDELNLADVRTSREKTIEAIVLGERLRSMKLYTEGFVHAAGKFESIKEAQIPKFELMSPKTGTRLARAAMDLDNRVANINHKLSDFDFPAIFSGILNSDTADERKVIRFKQWKTSFMGCRSFVLDYYKTKYGSWLPKAKSKKNDLTTSGLNRLVLLEMYRDFSNLYDFLVDRSNLTTRTVEGLMTEDDGMDFESATRRSLRRVLAEYDRSTPPVQPPIPFDLPLYPSNELKKDPKARMKKIKSDELNRMLKYSHNSDAFLTPFLEAFMHFEVKQAHGCSMDELWELRTGQWLFCYAVLQSLPMLVIDVPGVKFTEGVEYFLCEPPRSGVPWGREDTQRSRTWFGVAGGSHVVSLPTDIVEHGVEGVYRRSHCWKMAQQWSQNDAMMAAAVQETMQGNPLPAPPGFLDPNPGGRDRSQSPDRRRESVMNLGLEALPLPSGVAPASPAQMRPSSRNDPSKTFDAILQSADLAKPSKKKK
ncbi:hypothetical protein P154DRAFT_341994 [Amniculicola lignicola CBS 123094]|uniref:DUF8004 domain-containing protein n=1 Tax=Amniculicola lignicola CBS 123094 TaxID=1392246 RepID=A0A6A5W943_9PLEO|nr:hypothetical protein P154DRAFT_341994 [Amniculicola lignicola CBS 123094]